MYFLCTSYLPSQVSYSLRRLAAFQIQNLYIGPQPESELYQTKPPDLNPLFPGAEAKPDPIKGGLRVSSFFTYNCLAVSLKWFHVFFRWCHLDVHALCWLYLFVSRAFLNFCTLHCPFFKHYLSLHHPPEEHRMVSIKICECKGVKKIT